MDYKWVHSSAYSSLPPNAVIGGNEPDGAAMYVGRAIHEGDMLVAKVIPAKHIAFVSARGEALPKDSFEVLCSDKTAWRQCYDHVIPENAILCGKTSLGQPVYIGRGHYEGSLTVGKVSSVHRALFIPYKGHERRLESYEILVVNRNTPGWNVSEAAKPHPYPIAASAPLDEKVYPPLDTKPTLYPPPMPTPMAPTPPPYASCTPKPPPFEPPPPYAGAQLVMPPPPHFRPHPPPQPAMTAGHRAYDMWMAADFNNTPQNAVHGGHDADMCPIVICRAFHQGDLIPGKCIPRRRSAYISHSGREISVTNFEVLVGGNYYWLPAQNGYVPPGAVEGGRTCNGEVLYVGRGTFAGTLTTGKIQRSHQCLYVPFGGSERRINSYEVLIRRN